MTVFSAASEVVGGAASVYPEPKLELNQSMVGRATAWVRIDSPGGGEGRRGGGSVEGRP